jgi:hypothetical protein
VAGASVAVVALFVVQIALRKEVEHDPEEQLELERDAEVDRGLATRAQTPREPVSAAVED